MKQMDLLDIAKELRGAMRLGAKKDEPEGNRYIILSDTLVNHAADTLEKHFASLNSCQKKTMMGEIQAERCRQDIKWGEQNHNPIEWLVILMEEVGEASQAAVNGYFGDPTFYEEYRKEVVHVAAVAVAMMESYDRGKHGKEAQTLTTWALSGKEAAKT